MCLESFRYSAMIVIILLFSSISFSQSCFEELGDLAYRTSTSVSNDFFAVEKYLLTGIPSAINVTDTNNMSAIWEINDPELTPCGSILEVNSTLVYGPNMYLGFNCYAFQRGDYSGLWVLNIDDVLEPIETSAYSELRMDVYVMDIAAKNNFLYAGEYDSPMQIGDIAIYDIGDSSNLDKIGVIQFDKPIADLSISGNTLYVLTSTFIGNPSWSILFYDISNPVDPLLLGEYSSSGRGYGMTFYDPYIYIKGELGTDHGLWVLDASNKTSPVMLNFSPLFTDPYGSARQFRIKGSIGYTGTDQTYEIIDLHEPSNPTIQDSIPLGSSAGAHPYLLSNNTIFGFGGGITQTVGIHLFDISSCETYITTYVPVVAHTPGTNDTSWKSDVVIMNPTPQRQAVTLSYLPSGFDNTYPVMHSFPIEPGQSKRIVDVVDYYFQNSYPSGALKIETTEDLLISSRTYNDVSDGTFGQNILPSSDSDMVHDGQNAVLVGLSENAQFRTNLGLVNTGPLLSTIIAKLYNSEGLELDTRNYYLKPYSHLQIGQVFKDAIDVSLDNGYIVLSSVESGSTFIGYASVVDNVSGDATFVNAQIVDTGDQYGESR